MTTVRRALSRTTVVIASLALIAALIGLTWWAMLVPPVADRSVQPVAMPVTTTDVTYVCPSAPENTLGAVSVTDPSVTTRFTTLGQGAVARADDKTIKEPGLDRSDAPGLSVAVTPADQTGSADASGAVIVSSAAGELRGLAGAACRPATPTAWIVGGSGALGHSAQLRLTNPGSTAATATIRMYGSTGRLPLPRGGQLAVPAGKTVSVLLESSAEQDDRLAISVESDGADLAAVLVTEALDGETPAGTDMLTAGAGPARDLVVPGVVLTEQDAAASAAGDDGADAAGSDRSGAAEGEAQAATEPTDATTQGADEPTEGAGAEPQPTATSSASQDGASSTATSSSSVLRLVNPSTSEAHVSVTLLGAKGSEDLAGAEDLVVDPEAVVDVSLAGVTPGAYGVAVHASTPVAAAVRQVRHGDVYPAETGSAVADEAWTQATSVRSLARGSVTLPSQDAIAGQLVITNAQPRAVRVSVSATPGGTAVKTLTVPARATVSLALSSLDLPGSARVLTLDTGSSGLVSAALVLTQDVQAGQDQPAGQLIAVLPVSEDVALEASRSVILR